MSHSTSNYSYMYSQPFHRRSPLSGPTQQPSSYLVSMPFHPHPSTQNVIQSESHRTQTYQDPLYHITLAAPPQLSAESQGIKDDILELIDTSRTLVNPDFSLATPGDYNDADHGSDFEDCPPLFNLTQSTDSSTSSSMISNEPSTKAAMVHRKVTHDVDESAHWIAPIPQSPVSYSADDYYDQFIKSMTTSHPGDYPTNYTSPPTYFRGPVLQQADQGINPSDILQHQYSVPGHDLVGFSTSQAASLITVNQVSVADDSDLDAHGSLELTDAEEEVPPPSQAWHGPCSPAVFVQLAPSRNRAPVRKHAGDDDDEYPSEESDLEDSESEYDECRPKKKNRTLSNVNPTSGSVFRHEAARNRGRASRPRLSISSAPPSITSTSTSPTTRLVKNRGPPPRTQGRKQKEGLVCRYVQPGTDHLPCDSKTGNKYDLERHRREIHGLQEADCVLSGTLPLELAKWYFEDFAHMIVKKKCLSQRLNEDAALRAQAQLLMRTITHDDPSPMNLDTVPILRECAVKHAKTYRLWKCPHGCTTRNPIQTERAFLRHMRNHRK